MTDHQSEVALSEIVGFILLLALIVGVLALWVNYVVPVQGRDAEVVHSNEIKTRFTDYKITLDSLWRNNDPGVTMSTSFNLGTGGGNTQAGGLFIPLLHPIASTGTVSVMDQGDTLNIDCSRCNTTEVRSQFPLNISVLKYQTGNNYWVQQEYYYQEGGVFLLQEQGLITQGTSTRAPPPIFISRNYNDVSISIALIQLFGGSSMGGNGPARVDTRLTTYPQLNITNPVYQSNSWVNISVNVADNTTARMWRDLFNDIAIRDLLPSYWYNVGWTENPVTHRGTAYMNITHAVNMTVQNFAYYVTLNNIASVSPDLPTATSSFRTTAFFSTSSPPKPLKSPLSASTNTRETTPTTKRRRLSAMS